MGSMGQLHIQRIYVTFGGGLTKLGMRRQKLPFEGEQSHIKVLVMLCVPKTYFDLSLLEVQIKTDTGHFRGIVCY